MWKLCEAQIHKNIETQCKIVECDKLLADENVVHFQILSKYRCQARICGGAACAAKSLRWSV